jgi:hypothetical protein
MANRHIGAYLPLHARTLEMRTMQVCFSDGLEHLLVGDDQDRGFDHQRLDNHGDSLHRPTCTLTSDDAATVIGICVSLLTLITGALIFVVCFELLTVLSREWFQRWTF